MPLFPTIVYLVRFKDTHRERLQRLREKRIGTFGSWHIKLNLFERF